MLNWDIARSTLQPMCNAVLSVAAISPMVCPYSSVDAESYHIRHQHSIYASASCMDLRTYDLDPPSSRQLRPQQSDASLQQAAVPVTSGAYSSPLPEAQWSNIPLSFRPRNYNVSGEQHGQLGSHEWRLQQGIPRHALSRNPRTSKAQAPSKVRRRPGALRDLPQRAAASATAVPQVDHTLLYPQMSPYDNESDTQSPPTAMHYVPGAVSQPNTPSHLQTRFHKPPEPLPSLGIPRTPTYPPAGRRRLHSDPEAQEGAFRDEQDFRLFVEATAGLPPEPPEKQQRDRSRDPSSAGLSSPMEETPRTMHALHHFASMPDTAPVDRPHRVQIPQAGLDFGLEPPSATAPPSRPFVSPLEPTLGLEGEDLPPSEDELPDYASSQAQAQASQRAEAARRAQELQRRWRESTESR